MSEIYQISKQEYLISTDSSLLDIDVIHNYLSEESYWAKNIPRETVESAIANSVCFGLYCNSEQVGFARLITDKATFAFLADVFIVEGYRRKGLAKWLMEAIVTYPEVAGVRGILLRTRDAHELYKQFGWEEVGEESIKRYMVKYIMKEYPALNGD